MRAAFCHMNSPHPGVGETPAAICIITAGARTIRCVDTAPRGVQGDREGRGPTDGLPGGVAGEDAGAGLRTGQPRVHELPMVHPVPDPEGLLR